MTTTIEIPPLILNATRMSLADLRCELALVLFQQNKLSFGQARELAEMDVWDFQQLLGSRGIYPHYDVAELSADVQTLRRLGFL